MQRIERKIERERERIMEREKKRKRAAKSEARKAGDKMKIKSRDTIGEGEGSAATEASPPSAEEEVRGGILRHTQKYASRRQVF